MPYAVTGQRPAPALWLGRQYLVCGLRARALHPAPGTLGATLLGLGPCTGSLSSSAFSSAERTLGESYGRPRSHGAGLSTHSTHMQAQLFPVSPGNQFCLV